MNTSDFDYFLPQERIAQTPIEPRDHSRLLVIDRKHQSIEHHRFFGIIDYVQSGDVMVFNESRVIPARLMARKAGTGGKVEVLLLRQLENRLWEALVKPGRRVATGATLNIIADGKETGVSAEVTGVGERGARILRVSDDSLLPRLGQIPLPPYIHVPLAQPERYQTVYARTDGSVAAPTAGLHFTPELLAAIRQKGVVCLPVTLHIGLDTFRPVQEDDPLKHTIHSEYGSIGQEAAGELARAKKEGRRVICVGTTSVRIIEHAAQLDDSTQIQAFEGWVKLFILPGHRFRMVDAMITNFHLPCSTLLMLVTAFTGEELTRRAYNAAIASSYRFYSFGDAMLVL